MTSLLTTRSRGRTRSCRSALSQFVLAHAPRHRVPQLTAGVSPDYSRSLETTRPPSW